MTLQGPNYALAKTLQQWRGIVARCRDGVVVSSNLAPAARTASMVAGDNKNAGMVALALDGMGHFRPLAVFDSATVSACMAALLVHDITDPQSLANPAQALAHPAMLHSSTAFHGGTFRAGIKQADLGRLFVVGGKFFGRPAQPVSNL